ncbi:MAG: transcriptional regulator [Candidatus Kerfeldbacteria bacterium CG08_land_8_20_14_0_20_40_16]|uniref:Transcriptional regulator n=1 Tax=Candidatus Kerfeldbacteria bacterium CG08_land_8_20_14_0_20_40_16 TaxID=2014244 RepID=A0A2H0YV70_9BACT|nr:MAG: transcriptional regulator [Candidatus Kerfeldbacteria bacterium CG08_land_8_20_14_0_20_40_16]
MLKDQEIPKLFGKRLKEIRLQRKMSQGDIARTLGVHRSYISGIERGIRNPSLKNIERLARALNINPSELLKF